MDTFLSHFIKAMRTGCSFTEILKNQGYRNIVIYGAGDYGKLLFDEINKDLNVLCFLDRNASHITSEFEKYKIEILEPHKVNNINNIDVIVVTPYTQFYQIRKYLRKYTNAKVISIREILGQLLSEDRFIEMSNYLASYGTTLHLFSRPDIEMIDNPSIIEQTLMFSNLQNIESKYEFLKDYIYNDIEEFSLDYLKQIYSIESYPNNNTEQRIKDKTSEHMNIINGHRFIPALSENCQNTIYIFGDCSSFGAGSDDNTSMPNQLQQLINNSNLSYGVVSNVSLIRNIDVVFEKIKSLPLIQGDKIIYIDLAFLNKDHNYCFFDGLDSIYEHDLTSAFSRPHDFGEVFTDHYHIANRGYKILATEIFDDIFKCYHNTTKTKKLDQTPIAPHINISTSAFNQELDNYINFLEMEKININGKVGSIVVNCNPFTLGHLYLIQKAAESVDFLYIFVVEEDKSVFKFNERYELVKAGSAQIKNIKVIPSGKFIISSLTFENYFNKENLSKAEIDASLDLEIFATKIAPVLNINVRFAGTEPFCNVTRQYNRDMRRLLPLYGIEFQEIERVSTNEYQISATKVRELLKKGDFNEMKKLVPESTLTFLINNRELILDRMAQKSS